MEPLDNNTPVTLTLTAQDWQVVLEALSDGRHRIVAPVIARLVQQLEKISPSQNDPALLNQASPPAPQLRSVE